MTHTLHLRTETFFCFASQTVKKLKYTVAFLLMAGSVQAQTWAGSTSPTGNAYRSGNVGFGTMTGPIAPIHVGATCGVPAGIQIDCYAPSISGLCSSQGLVSPDAFIVNTMPVFLAPLKTEFIVKSSGFIGIGTATPAAKLDVQGAGSADIANFKNSSGTVLLKVANSNRVGVGITSPAAQLDVQAIGSNVPLQVRNNVGTVLFKVNTTGTVQIGNVTTPSGYKLYVEQGILTEKVKVAVKNTGDWSDFVFDESYKLKTLDEVNAFIKENKHLPDVPSAENVVKEGLDLAKMDAKLLQKVEELTLYIIEQEKRIKDLEIVITNLKK